MSTEDWAIPQVLCEFLEIIIHNILYRRGIYPKSTFIITKAYGLPVYQCVHPQLSEYISEMLKAVLFHLKNKTLRQIMLNIIISNITIEKYTVDVLEVNEHIVTDLYESLEHAFRTFCLKVESAVKCLEEVPKEASFLIHLGITNHSMILFSEKVEYSHFPWGVDEINDESSEIIPIYLFESKEVKLHLFVEKNRDAIQG